MNAIKAFDNLTEEKLRLILMISTQIFVAGINHGKHSKDPYMNMQFLD
jgi:hypothetical protein